MDLYLNIEKYEKVMEIYANYEKENYEISETVLNLGAEASLKMGSDHIRNFIKNSVIEK